MKKLWLKYQMKYFFQINIVYLMIWLICIFPFSLNLRYILHEWKFVLDYEKKEIYIEHKCIWLSKIIDYSDENIILISIYIMKKYVKTIRINKIKWYHHWIFIKFIL